VRSTRSTARGTLARVALELVPLTPARVDDYLAFFDRAFADNPAWSGCYRGLYDDPRADDAWSADPSAAPAHRAARAARIRSGRAHGLLAFDAGRVVGWRNAGPRASPVGSLMCFVIAPERRRQGVATALLGGAEALFRGLGLSIAEAYPRAAPSPDEELPITATIYRGAPETYQRAGYTPHRRFERFVCVRKSLS
jgi:GNAT superfamily N-acetyltransferase